MKLQRFPVLLMVLIFLSMLPVTMIVPVLKDVIKDRFLSGNMEVALFTSISMLGSFLFSPIAGLISDRLGNRHTVISIACFLDSALFYLMTVLTDISWILTIRFLEGAVHIFVIGLLLASVSDRENHPNSRFFRMGKLMGIAGMFLSMGAAIGMPLGGIGKGNPNLPFYIGSLIFIFVGVLSYFYLQDMVHQNEQKFLILELLQSLSFNPFLLVPFAFHFVDRFTVGFIVSSFNIYMREFLNFSPGEAGFYMGLVLLPMSLLSLPSALLTKKIGIFNLVMLGSLVYGVFLSLSGWTLDKSILLVYLLVSGIGAGLMYVPSMILASRMSPVGLNATVMSAFTGIGSLGFMTGPILSVSLESYYQSIINPDCVMGSLSTTFGMLEILLVLITLPFSKNLKFN